MQNLNSARHAEM